MSAFYGTIYDHAKGQIGKTAQTAISVTAQARLGSVRVTFLGENKEDPMVVVTVTEGHASSPRREILRARLSTLLMTPCLTVPSGRER